MTDESTVLFIRNIPKKLKKEFKALCAKEGITMTEVIKKWIAKASKRGKT